MNTQVRMWASRGSVWYPAAWSSLWRLTEFPFDPM